MKIKFLYRSLNLELNDFEVINSSEDRILLAVRTYRMNGEPNKSYFDLIHLLKNEEVCFYTGESSNLKIAKAFSKSISSIASISYVEIVYCDK